MTQPGEVGRPPGGADTMRPALASGDGNPGLELGAALGDIGALHQRGRPAVRLHLRDRAAGVARVLDAARSGATGSSR